MADLDIKYPDYTTLSKCGKKFNTKLEPTNTDKKVNYVSIASTPS